MEFLMSEDLDIQFFFDQDQVGVRKAVNMLEKGHKVFLWQKLIEDLLKNKTDKYAAKNYLLKVDFIALSIVWLDQLLGTIIRRTVNWGSRGSFFVERIKASL